MGPTDPQEGRGSRYQFCWGELLQKWGFSYRNLKGQVMGIFVDQMVDCPRLFLVLHRYSSCFMRPATLDPRVVEQGFEFSPPSIQTTRCGGCGGFGLRE